MAIKSNLKPMPSVWRSLLWKEWQEQKWQMAGLTAVIVILPLFFANSEPETLLVVVTVSLLCYGILAGLFVGMSTAARENQRGTMRFMQSLPVSMAKPAAARLALSCSAVVVPILALICLCTAYLMSKDYHPIDVENILDWTRQTEMFASQSATTFGKYSLFMALTSCVFATSLLTWMATCGVNRSDEIRAGAVGFLAIVAIWLAINGVWTWAESAGWETLEKGLLLVMAGAPGGPGLLENLSAVGFGTPWPYVAVATVAHGVLVWQFLRRYGRGSVRPVRTSDERVMKSQTEWLSPPRKSQFTAIVWKQVNETGPLAIVAAAAVLLFAGIICWLNTNHYSEALARCTLGVGYLVTVVAGMGVFLEDLKPKIGGFWRSRPVNTTQWFFVKFFTGLTVLAACFGALFVIASLLPGGQRLFEEVSWLQLTVFALLLVLTYAISMASYCLGRHPIVAVCSTLGLLCSGGFGFGVLVDRDIIRSEVETGIGLMLFGLLAAIGIAWRTLRNNWGWQGR